MPRPSARESSDFDESLAIVGRHGAGLLFLHGPNLRIVSGHDWRKRADGLFEPHGDSRNLVTGRRTIPWMHHPFGPHVIVPREDDRCDLYVIAGTFGPRSQWGDGVEANYPQYGILKCAKDRTGKIWEQGAALEIAVSANSRDGRRIEETFRRNAWRFRHEPGRIAFLAVDPAAMLRSVVLLIAPSRPAELRVHVEVAPPPGGATAIEVLATARLLLKKVLLPEPSFRGTVDVLNAPFGYGRFVTVPIAPVVDAASGVRFDGGPASEGVAPYFVCGERPADVRVWSVDPTAATVAGTPADPAGVRAAGEAFEVALLARRIGGPQGESTRLDFFLGAETGAATPTPASLPEAVAEIADRFDGPSALRIATGDRYVDGYARFARATARSLVWPNGVVATGALGYGGMGHVAQDVPFFYPVLLFEGDDEYRRAAVRNLEFVFESPSRNAATAGILDHPCDGLDFSFQPFDPRRARVWKARGAAGFFRQVASLARYWAWTGDDERVERWFATAIGTLAAHYLPYAPDAPAWSEGEETQDRLYVHLAAPPALAALAEMAEAFSRPGDAARCREARAAVAARIGRPLADGGFVVTEDLVGSDGETFPAGLVANPDYLKKGGKWHTFDAPLYNGAALLSGALADGVRDAIVAHFSDLESSPWFVPGAGFSKRHRGEWGVWHWHNAVLAQGLFQNGAPDAAFELLRLMGRGVVDVNGIGCPGEETNGGSYAMAIGCLGLVTLVEGLFGLRPTRAGLAPRPSLPRAVRAARIENVFFRGRRRRLEIERGPVASAAIDGRAVADPSRLDLGDGIAARIVRPPLPPAR